MKSTISSRGQITIPAKVQRALGMRAGTPVEFELREDGVLMRKRVPDVDPFDQVYGILKGLPPTDVLMRELRGPTLDELKAADARRRARRTATAAHKRPSRASAGGQRNKR